jgi:hypothetical protein
MLSVRSWLAALVCAVAFCATAALATDSGSAAPAAAAVSSAPGAAGAEMPGCPGKADGSPCCTSCQDQRAKIAAGEAKPAGGCPCQRARAAREAAAKRAAEQQ